jgi:hypothetical protein
MAAPLKSRKQTVNMAGPVRVSRIRRDPPPIAKKVIERSPDERDTRVVVIGVIAFGLAIFIITLGFSSYQAAPSAGEPIQLNLD